MASIQGHSHDDCSDHDHGDDNWIEVERTYNEKSTEEESLIEWLTKNVDLYLPSAVASSVTVSILCNIVIQFVKLNYGLLKGSYSSFAGCDIFTAICSYSYSMNHSYLILLQLHKIVNLN